MQDPVGNSSRLLLTVPGGTLLGAVAGGALAVGIGSSALSNSDAANSPSGGFGLGIVLLYMVVIGAIVGAITGGVLVGWMSVSRWGRTASIVLAAIGYLAGAVGGWSLLRWERSATVGAKRIAAASRQTSAPRPPVRSTSTLSFADLSAAYGALAYPNAEIVPSTAPSPRPGVPCALVMTTSIDPFEQVVTYYKLRMSTQRDTERDYLGTATRVSDGRMAIVHVHVINEVVYVEMSAG